MDVKEIVKKYLKDNGYGGLGCDSCACDIDDLMPCSSEDIGDCDACYRIKCNQDTCDNENCEVKGDEDNKWCYTKEKPKESRDDV